MKLAVISFTQQGAQKSAELANQIREKDIDIQIESITMKQGTGEYGAEPVHRAYGKYTLSQWTEYAMKEKDALLFIGATGIAVRSIAPFIEDKYKDPAVLSMDEKGKYMIPLLSGHVGGANELAERLAKLLGAIPVITTATDLNGIFSVDEFAKKNELHICRRVLAKKISANLLEGGKVGLTSVYEIEGKIPKEIFLEKSKRDFYDQKTKYGICIGSVQSQENENTLCLLPKKIVLGIGVKKGITSAQIEECVKQVFAENGIAPEQIWKLVSIDLKKEERGIVEFAETLGVPYETYCAEQLQKVQGEFTASDFVMSVTGVDNVCERAAVLGTDQGVLLMRKRTYSGVALAIAAKNRRIHFG